MRDVVRRADHVQAHHHVLARRIHGDVIHPAIQRGDEAERDDEREEDREADSDCAQGGRGKGGIRNGSVHG